MRICIFGASGRELDARYYAEAEAVGRLIGENGDSIVFGGGAEGLMGACARGVSAAGGDVVGIAPRFFDEPGILYDKCSRMIFTETMRERKQRLADLAKEYKADGIIVASNKFCEYWSYERTIDTIVMPRDFGYPVCSIEKEYINGASGQLRTRFQAFVESIEIKKIQEGK